MESMADHWIRVNGYLIEVFEGPRGDDLIRIDGKSVKEGVTYQEAVRICANSTARPFGSQPYYFDEDPAPVEVRNVRD